MALLIAAVIAGPAGAKARSAKFKMTVAGVQSSTWTRDETHETDSDLHCGIHTLQNGSEHIAFATAKPLAVTVQPYRYGGFTVPKFVFSKKAGPGFAVGATVDRAETDNSQDTCTGQPYPPSQPLDCGRKQAPWHLTVATDYRRSGGIWLGIDLKRDPDDEIFQTCYQTLFEYPTIQDHNPNGDKTWAGAVPNAKFFNKKKKRIVVTANRNAKGDPQTTSLDSSSVHLDWKLVLKRVHRRPGS